MRYSLNPHTHPTHREETYLSSAVVSSFVSSLIPPRSCFPFLVFPSGTSEREKLKKPSEELSTAGGFGGTNQLGMPWTQNAYRSCLKVENATVYYHITDGAGTSWVESTFRDSNDAINVETQSVLFLVWWISISKFTYIQGDATSFFCIQTGQMISRFPRNS